MVVRVKCKSKLCKVNRVTEGTSQPFGRGRSGYENTSGVSRIQDFEHKYSSLPMENIIFSLRVLGYLQQYSLFRETFVAFCHQSNVYWDLKGITIILSF